MKKFITLALSFLLLFTAVACSNKGQAQPESANKVADKTYMRRVILRHCQTQWRRWPGRPDRQAQFAR